MRHLRTALLGPVGLAFALVAPGSGVAADRSQAMEQHMRLMDAGNPGMERMMELMEAGNPGMRAMMAAPPFQEQP